MLFLPGGLAEAIQQGHLILTDGTHAPYREPPNQSRTNHDKDFSTAIARIRVNIEHCIAQLKTWRILSHGYRGRLKELPGIIHLATNLEILRTYAHNQPRE
ncbi:transposase family protein [Arachnia propionica]|uniref:transposase family protein n=1 Tax=Arachnia propionica TaxID=1750 RepID=UPI0030D2666B